MKEKGSPAGNMCSPIAREGVMKRGGRLGRRWKDQYLISVLSSLWTVSQ